MSISSVEVFHYPLTIHVDYLCDDTTMITYESSGDDLYNAMVDYGDSLDDYVIDHSPYCNLSIGFELSFPKCGIGVYLMICLFDCVPMVLDLCS